MIDVETVLNTISKQTKVIAIQRSKGMVTTFNYSR